MEDNALSKINTRDMAHISLAVALNAVCAFLTVPGTVPFTLQTFSVFFTLLYLGGKKGAVAVWLYIFFGAIGLPLFSGFRGGFSVLLSATGGFIMAFAAVALLYFIASFFKLPRFFEYLLAAISLALIYFGGCAWFTFIMGGGLKHALMICVVPFMIPDVIKMILAFLLSARLKKIRQG